MAPGQRKRVQSRRNLKKQPAGDDGMIDDDPEHRSESKARGKREAEGRSGLEQSTVTTLKIAGYDVLFPQAKPYPAQVLLMSKVLSTLKNSTAEKTGSSNAILESPTGTGKTLAMLSAVLAWQQREKANITACAQSRLCGQGAVSGCGEGGGQAYCENEQGQRDGQGAAQPHNSGAQLGFEGEALTGARLGQDAGGDYASAGGFLPGPAGPSAPMSGRASHDDAAEQFTNGDKQPGKKKTPPPPPRPRIFYTTRTHSQLTQVCAELKRCTGYKATMTILASRKHLCCNNEVAKKPVVDEVCKDLLRSMSENMAGAGCQYFRNVKVLTAHKAMQPEGRLRVHNIEDLRDLGQQVKGCAYFASRAAVADCDIILCPYTYLLSPRIRGTLDVTLRGAVVIIDEAHNIEENARESASVALRLADLRTARMELSTLAMSDQLPKGISRGRRGGKEQEAGPETSQQEAYQALADLLTDMISWLQGFLRAPPLGGAQGPTHGEHGQAAQPITLQIFSNDGILSELSKAGVQLSQFEMLQQHFNKVIAEPRASGAGQEEGEDGPRQHDASGLSGLSAGILEGLFTGLRFMLSDGCRHLSAFRMAITREEDDSSAQSTPTQPSVTLNLWCMDPAVAFEDMAVNCRAVLLMSGTLAPMDSLALELGAPFPKSWRMEGQHVIDTAKQLWAGVLPFGPKGRSLNASYAQASSLAFQEEVGEALLQLCEVVPGGVLVFFRSFSLMNTLVKRWKGTGMLPKLAALKTYFEEPRGVDEAELENFLKRYKVAAARYTAKPGRGRQLHAGGGPGKGLQNPTGGGPVEGAGLEVGVGGEGSKATRAASAPARRRKAGGGAIMFAVFRGKISEGIDFSDSAARAVVVIGIPYPNSKDQQVILKKAYNDERCNRSAAERHSSGQAFQQGQHLSGAAWYSQGAFRALNQAIGRVIRHQNDYGAVILLDERLSNAGSQDQISKWVRGQLRVHHNFAEAKDQLQNFFARAEAEFAAKAGRPGFKPPAARGALTSGGEGAPQPMASVMASPHKSPGTRTGGQGGAGRKGSAALSGDKEASSTSLGSTGPSTSRGSIEDLWARRRLSASNSGGTAGMLGRTDEVDEEEGEEVLSSHSPAVAAEVIGAGRGVPQAMGGTMGWNGTGRGNAVAAATQAKDAPALRSEIEEQQRSGPKAHGAGQNSTGLDGGTRGKDPFMDSVCQGQIHEWKKKKGADSRGFSEAPAVGQGLQKPPGLGPHGQPGGEQPRACDPGPRTATSAGPLASGAACDRPQGTIGSATTAPFPTPSREHEARFATSNTPSTAMGPPSLPFSPTRAMSAQSAACTSGSQFRPLEPQSASGAQPPAQPLQQYPAQASLDNRVTPIPMRLEHEFGRVAASTLTGEQSPEMFQGSSRAQGYDGGWPGSMEQAPAHRQEKQQARQRASPLGRQGQGRLSGEDACRRDAWDPDEKENATPATKKLREDPYARSPGIMEALLATQRYSPGARNMALPLPPRELGTQAALSLRVRPFGQERPAQQVTLTSQRAGTSLVAPASEGPASAGSTAAACSACGAHVVTVQARSGASSCASIPVVSVSKKYLVRLTGAHELSNTPGGSMASRGDRAWAVPPRPLNPGTGSAAIPAAKPGVRVRAVDATLCSWESGEGGVEMGEEVWVKEDGCVFCPVFCKGCQRWQRTSQQPLGVLVLAANMSSRHLNGKALLFKDRTTWIE